MAHLGRGGPITAIAMAIAAVLLAAGLLPPQLERLGRAPLGVAPVRLEGSGEALLAVVVELLLVLAAVATTTEMGMGVVAKQGKTRTATRTWGAGHGRIGGNEELKKRIIK